MIVRDLLQQLRTCGVILQSAPGGTLHYTAPKGLVTPDLVAAMHQHKAALLALLAQPTPVHDAPTPEPDAVPSCPHPRTGRRADGTLVCLSCVAVYVDGVWTPQTISYCTAAHRPSEPTPTDGPTRQCRHCPHVWQVPCASCTAVAWKFIWQAEPRFWFCPACGAVYGSTHRVTATHAPGCPWLTGARTRCTCDPVLTPYVDDGAQPPVAWRCPWCQGTQRRRSISEILLCAICHPPADAALVAAWEDNGNV